MGGAPSSAAAVPRWWQWPTILSLDAPAVAVVWQWLFSTVVAVQLRWHHHALLAAATWLVYAADRWIEGLLVAPERLISDRHRFYQRWRWSTFAAWLAVAAAGLVLASTRLTRAEGTAGAILGLPVLAYLLSQSFGRRHARLAPKEILIAVLFALGTACMPFLHRSAPAVALALPVACFTLLCFANCALISSWETEVDRSQGQTSLALSAPGLLLPLRSSPWLIAFAALVAALAAPEAQRTALWCSAASGALLGAVDVAHRRIGRQLARVLADVALLSPLAPLFAAVLLS
ncbi:MAG: hypothetical protein KDE27_27585 [Planctomycetes bacterium]|nr:hypothetical protein [Planctomycetota bacterium]